MAPAVVGLLRGVEEGRTWTLAHLEKARKLLVTELADLLHVLPPALGHLLLQIDSELPSNVKSLAGSACSHILFATIYTSISNLLPELRKARVAREKIDFLIAFCENLCNLDIVADMLWVNECLTSSLQVAPYLRKCPKSTQHNLQINTSREWESLQMMRPARWGKRDLMISWRWVALIHSLDKYRVAVKEVCPKILAVQKYLLNTVNFEGKALISVKIPTLLSFMF